MALWTVPLVHPVSVATVQPGNAYYGPVNRFKKTVGFGTRSKRITRALILLDLRAAGG